MKHRIALLIASLLIAIFSAGAAGARTAHAACGTTYVVGQGESLYDIAQKCSLSYVVLMDINYEISDPNLIHPGQIIRLTAEIPLDQYTQPASGPAQPDGLQPDGYYIIRPGDSLARIAYLYGTTLWDLYDVNPQLGGSPVVYTGQSIRLPQNARQRKGWVGVSSLEPAVYSSIIVRVVDFPPYANIKFRLHEVFLDEPTTGIKDAGPQDIVRDDTSSLYIDATTDSRGSARVTIHLPYWAYYHESWVVDVFTDNLGAADTLARSPVLWIGGQP